MNQSKRLLWRSPSAHTLYQLLRTISLLYGRWSTSGSDRGNAHFFTATWNTIEGTGEKKKKEQTNNMLGLTQVQKESYVTLCMCRLTLVWTLPKLPQSYWNADSIFFHWSGPSLIPTRLSAPVSGVDWSLASPFANCQLLSLFLSHSLTGVPSTLPVTSRSRVQNTLSCFAPKQTKESSAWRTTYTINNTYPKFFINDPDRLLDMIDALVIRRSNPMVHRITFVSISQHEDGPIQQYLVCFRTTATDLNFSCLRCEHDLSDICIKDKFIRGIANDALQINLLAKAGVLKSLDQNVSHAKAFLSARQGQIAINDTSDVGYNPDVDVSQAKEKQDCSDQRRQYWNLQHCYLQK